MRLVIAIFTFMTMGSALAAPPNSPGRRGPPERRGPPPQHHLGVGHFTDQGQFEFRTFTKDGPQTVNATKMAGMVEKALESMKTISCNGNVKAEKIELNLPPFVISYDHDELCAKPK